MVDVHTPISGVNPLHRVRQWRSAAMQELLLLGAVDDSEARAFAQEDPIPWWLKLLLCATAWLASLLVLLALMLLSNFGISMRVLGAAVCLAAGVLLSQEGRRIFAQNAGLALSLSGQVLLCWAFGEKMGAASQVLWVSAALAAVLTLPRTTILHRCVCALVALGCLVASFLVASPRMSWPALEGVCLCIAAAALALWAWRVHWTQYGQEQYAGFFKAWAFACTAVSMVLALPTVRHGFWMVNSGFQSRSLMELPVWVYSWGAALLFVAVCYGLVRRLPDTRRWLLWGAAWGFAAVALQWPGLLVVAALALAAFHACHRIWFGVLLFWAALVVGNYYYDMSATLLAKSISMMAMGSILLLLRWGVARHEARRDA